MKPTYATTELLTELIADKDLPQPLLCPCCRGILISSRYRPADRLPGSGPQPDCPGQTQFKGDVKPEPKPRKPRKGLGKHPAEGG